MVFLEKRTCIWNFKTDFAKHFIIDVWPGPKYASEESCSQQELFYEKGILENFSKFPGKHPCQSLFSNKVARTLLFIERLCIY